MRVPIYGYFFLFLLSCGQRKAAVKPSDKDSAVAVVKDSFPKSAVDTSKNVQVAESTSPDENDELERISLLELQNFTISAWKDHSEKKDYLVAYSKFTKRSDTIDISSQYEDDENDIHIVDATDSLRVKPFIIEVMCQSGSDWWNHAFIGYDSGKLKNLFDIDDFPDPKRLHLHRKDKMTLTGFVAERDDLVHAFEKYPVEVSLKDYKVTFPDVPALHVGWESEVLESFKANRIINNQVSDSMYTVKKGARLMVDTLYVPQNKVRLTIYIGKSKSIPLETSIDNVKDKITENAAG